MYLCVKGIDFAPFYDYGVIRQRGIFVFHFISTLAFQYALCVQRAVTKMHQTVIQKAVINTLASEIIS